LRRAHRSSNRARGMTCSEPPTLSIRAHGLRVRVVPYAELRRQVLREGEDVRVLELPDGSTVDDALRVLDVTVTDRLIVGMDGAYATGETLLRDNAELVLVTPMEGG
jgi:hypothetical protein